MLERNTCLSHFLALAIVPPLYKRSQKLFNLSRNTLFWPAPKTEVRAKAWAISLHIAQKKRDRCAMSRDLHPSFDPTQVGPDALLRLETAVKLVDEPAQPADASQNLRPRAPRSKVARERRSAFCACAPERCVSLPLFATDKLLGAALLGPERVLEWVQIAPLLEERGMPKVDDFMGGRYVPAVRAFFDRQYGLDRSDANASPLAPDGVEDFKAWKNKNHRS
jgi:hypothetical protein